MKIQEVKIKLMENVFYCSSELGNEFRTYGLIGNTALPYALHLSPSPYKKFKTPQYKKHFQELREKGIYITPVTFKDPIDFKTSRFNSIPERYNHAWNFTRTGKAKNDKRRKENFPDEGWFKLLRKGNIGFFYIISPNGIDVPDYIRIGKFMSKCKLQSKEKKSKEVKGKLKTDIYLRAEDIDPEIKITQYSKKVIQHGCYLKNMNWMGKGHKVNTSVFRSVVIPKNTAFYISEIKK